MTDQAEVAAREIVREVDRDWDTFDNRTDDLPESEWPPAALQLVTVIAAAIRSAEPQWRDIATAPKDGRSILIYEREYRLMDRAYWVDGSGWHNGSKRFRYSSHWMPLPAPPAPPEAISGKEG